MSTQLVQSRDRSEAAYLKLTWSVVELFADNAGHTNIATTERYCNIPPEMREEHFPSYLNQGKIPLLYV